MENKKPHGVAGQVNIYTLDKDSVITAHGQHARVVAFLPSYDRDYPQFSTVLYCRVDIRDGLREPTPAEVLTVARKDQNVKGKWTLHERNEWETRPNIDFIFVPANEVKPC